MNILVLGGTKFVGRAFVESALRMGHSVTLFNRGKQDPGAWPGLEQVHGDRTAENAFAPFAGRRFDAVVDPAAYLPRDVAKSAAFFAPRCDRYLLVSSISVHASHAEFGANESTPVGRLTPEQEKEVAELSADGPIPAAKLGPYYGPLKALCEEVAERALGTRATVIRPGLVVGPHDNTDRFTYWPARFRRGGTVLAPGRPERVVQFVDVRDLADFMRHALEKALPGIWQVTGPAAPLPFGEVIASCARVATQRGAPPSTLRWVDDAALVAQGVTPWTEMPLWIPESAEGMEGFMHADCAKARGGGLTYRALDDTVAATYDWDASRNPEAPRNAGLAAKKEAEILAALPL